VQLRRFRETAIMAWETRRNGRRYYYTARRVDGRVVKEYMGRDNAATQAFAKLEWSDAERARIARRRQLQREAEYLELDRELEEFHEWCDLIFKAAMLVAGYHQHARGHWRKRRVKRETPQPVASATPPNASRQVEQQHFRRRRRRHRQRPLL
jgi:hypothetical protein